jgi:hypothetical protein
MLPLEMRNPVFDALAALGPMAVNSLLWGVVLGFLWAAWRSRRARW